MSVTKDKTTNAILKCPECGANQHPRIDGDSAICKYCGHASDRGGWHGARYGTSKYASAEERDAAWREMKREWAANNRHKMNAYQRKYERSDKGRLTRDIWRRMNADALRRSKHEHYARNRDRYLELQRDWRAENGMLHKQANVKSKVKRLLEMENDRNDRHHGTWTGYSYGCRCGRCKRAARERNREHRMRRSRHAR